MSDDAEFLSDFLKRVSDNAALHPEDYSRLVTSFNPSKPSLTRSRAFIALSSICVRKRSETRDEEQYLLEAQDIRHAFLPIIERLMADVDEQSIIDALAFIAALFAVDADAAFAIFAYDGLQDSMLDSLDLFLSSSAMHITVAKILSLAAGHKKCRSIMSPKCFSWLETTYRLTASDPIKAATAVALIKLSNRVADTSLLAGQVQDERFTCSANENDIFASLKNVIKFSDRSLSSIVDAVEGLAYLSAKPAYKEDIADDVELLKSLMSLRSSLQKDSMEYGESGSVLYGLALIVVNLTTYKVQLTEEQAQINRLRRMVDPSADSESSKGSFDDASDDDEHVKSRGRKLMAAGIHRLLVSISRVSESATTRIAVGKALFGLVEDKDNRGLILQDGGAKTLMAIIRSLQQPGGRVATGPSEKSLNDFAELQPVQALAKLAITASPMQVFGPNENMSIEAVRPLASLILHPSSTLLQKFEGMMALTNLTSASAELAQRTAKIEGLFPNVESMLLEEHTLIRRAATELLCNLVSSSEFAYSKFIGGDLPDATTSVGQAKSRTQVLSALCDVNDKPTRLAASGALAILTGSPAVCNLLHALILERHQVFIILKDLIDPPDSEIIDSGLLHRGIVCIRNILIITTDDDMKQKLLKETVDHGVAASLLKVAGWVKDGKVPQAAVQPLVEAIKWLVDCGLDPQFEH